MFQTGINHIHHAFDGHFENQIGFGVEEFSAVDVGKMAYRVDALGPRARRLMHPEYLPQPIPPWLAASPSFSFEPRELLSRERTLAPAATSALTRPAPMKPVPPVTR